jgi:AcrR family transcriptional regulator
MIEQHKIADHVKTAPEDTRERILLAAREVIGRKGKRGATTREIADSAGVNEATIFRHFGNKEALIVAVAKHSCPDVQMRGFIGTLQGSLEDDLLQIAHHMNAFLESRIDMIRWSLVEGEYENSIFAQETWRPQTAVRAVVSEYLEKFVISGELTGNPEELATFFMGMIFMRVVAREKFPDTHFMTNNDYALRQLVNIFLNGVRSK